MKKTWKAVALGVTLSLCMAMMSACQSKKETEKSWTPPSGTGEETTAEPTTTEEETTTSEETTTETTIAVTTEDGSIEGYPVELTDIYGTTTVIKEKPARIVSLSPACTELVYSFGQEAALVGRTSACNYPESVSAIESIGDIMAPDVEKIVSLNPDIVLTDSTMTPEATVKQLRELGLTVVILNEGTNFDGVYTKIENVGKIFNDGAKATEIVTGMKKKIADIQEAIKGVNAHPTVYYVVGFGENGDWTATGDSFINDIITMAGGDNIAKDGQLYSYNVEDLVSKDPNIIILPAWADGSFQKTAPYSELTAVKEGHVIVLESTDTLDRQCARNAEAVEMLAKAFYPEIFEQEKAA